MVDSFYQTDSRLYTDCIKWESYRHNKPEPSPCYRQGQQQSAKNYWANLSIAMRRAHMADYQSKCGLLRSRLRHHIVQSSHDCQSIIDFRVIWRHSSILHIHVWNGRWFTIRLHGAEKNRQYSGNLLLNRVSACVCVCLRFSSHLSSHRFWWRCSNVLMFNAPLCISAVHLHPVSWKDHPLLNKICMSRLIIYFWQMCCWVWCNVARYSMRTRRHINAYTFSGMTRCVIISISRACYSLYSVSKWRQQTKIGVPLHRPETLRSVTRARALKCNPPIHVWHTQQTRGQRSADDSGAEKHEYQSIRCAWRLAFASENFIFKWNVLGCRCTHSTHHAKRWGQNPHLCHNL